MQSTEPLTLRGGRNCWRDAESPQPSDAVRAAVEIAVIGAGVMGAMVVQRLAQAGMDVAVYDQWVPATGATAASTALVMWGADIPLTHLAKMVGEEKQRWRSVCEAVGALNQLICGQGLACGWIARPEIYLAGDVLDTEALDLEGKLRRQAGLPSDFLEAGAVGERFQIADRPGLLSASSSLDATTLYSTAPGPPLSVVRPTGYRRSGQREIWTMSIWRRASAAMA